MCGFFVNADPIQYEQRTRTVRIHGVLTSLRLENMVWDILAEIAEAEGSTTNMLIAKFHDEILAARAEVPNFASFLRIACMRYLRRLSLPRQIPTPRPTLVPLVPPVPAEVRKHPGRSIADPRVFEP